MCNKSDYSNLKLCYQHRPLVQQELEVWHKYYLPVGKNVLDLGAGCGETVAFYLKHGAEKVLAVECDEACLDNLKANFGDDPRVSIAPFLITDIKMDIEGAEIGMKFEAHKPFRVRRLFGFAYQYTTFNAIEEYWGGPVTKVKRLIARALLK